MHKIIICPQLVRAASFGKEMLETRKKIKVEVVEEEHGAKTISDKHVGRTNVYFILALVWPRRRTKRRTRGSRWRAKWGKEADAQLSDKCGKHFTEHFCPQVTS